jgi:hypothetical protein
MLTRRGVVVGLALLAMTQSAVAAEPSAQEFLGGIYANYKGKDAKGIAYGQRGNETTRYFTPSLARLIDADRKAAAKRGDVPELDGDPFVNAQDWEIDAFAIEVKDTGPGKAVGTVKFKNGGEAVTVIADLVKTKDGWRIDDLRGPGRSLRKMFNKK